MNGIILNGKVFEAIDSKESSCLYCDMIDDRGMCDFKEFCFNQGRNNIFRFSQSLTEKINNQ